MTRPDRPRARNSRNGSLISASLVAAALQLVDLGAAPQRHRPALHRRGHLVVDASQLRDRCRQPRRGDQRLCALPRPGRDRLPVRAYHDPVPSHHRAQRRGDRHRDGAGGGLRPGLGLQQTLGRPVQESLSPACPPADCACMPRNTSKEAHGYKKVVPRQPHRRSAWVPTLTRSRQTTCGCRSNAPGGSRRAGERLLTCACVGFGFHTSLH